MAWVKLHSSLVDSSLWDQPPATLKVFIGLLVKCDPNGDVLLSRQALVRLVGLSSEEVDSAIKYLEEPDLFSRGQAEGGRRILPVAANCWHVVNYVKFRAARDDGRELEASKARSRAYRERQRAAAVAAMSISSPGVTEKRDASVTSRPSRQVEVEVEGEGEGNLEGEETASAEPDGADSAQSVLPLGKATEGWPGSSKKTAPPRSFFGDEGAYAARPRIDGIARGGESSGVRDSGGSATANRAMFAPATPTQTMPSSANRSTTAGIPATAAAPSSSNSRSTPGAGAVQGLHGRLADTSSPVFCDIPLYGPEPRRRVAVHRDFLEDAEPLYEGIDLERETEKAREWCLETGKGPGSADGVRKFLLDWYDRTQEWKDDPVSCLEQYRT
jgi:hypothetical protein